MNPTTRNSALTARARRYIADAAHAFEHAPVEVSLSVLLAIAFSYTLASDAEPFREWVELAVVALLAGAVAFTATLLHALGAWSARTRWIATITGAVAAALYGVLVVDLQLAAEAWRAAALVAAAALLVIAAPALAGGSDASERFRRVTGRLMLRVLAVLLYAAALYAGLALALGAINTLFELKLDARIYFHVFGWVFIVLVTWVIIGGVPDYVRPAEERGAVASAVHRMSAFLVTPLLAIYYVILYAYAIRIAITVELPKNLVSPLVIAAGVIAGIALLLFDRPDDDPATFRSLRAAAPLLIPLCVLGMWAITVRLNQYGWTEFRALRIVLLAAMALLALGAVVTIVRRRRLQLHLLPLGLAGVLTLAAIGPWSVMAVSRRSQQARLSDALTSVGLDWNADVVSDSMVANEPYTQIRETSRYLLTHHGPDALPPLFARHATGTGYRDVVHDAGLRSVQPDPGNRGGFAQVETGAMLFADTTDDALHYVRIERAVASHDSMSADSATHSYRVRIPIAGMSFIADLDPIARQITTRDMHALSPQLARVILRDDDGVGRGELFVLEIGVGPDTAARVHRLVGVARLTPR